MGIFRELKTCARDAHDGGKLRVQTVFKDLAVSVAFIAEMWSGEGRWCARRWTHLWGPPAPCLVLSCRPQAPSAPHTHALRLCCDWCFQTSHLPRLLCSQSCSVPVWQPAILSPVAGPPVPPQRMPQCSGFHGKNTNFC